jgi:glycerol uptake facilitator-like aquaporin
VLLGTGVVATVVLPKSKGFNGGWLLINFGWAWRSSPAHALERAADQKLT